MYLRRFTVVLLGFFSALAIAHQQVSPGAIPDTSPSAPIPQPVRQAPQVSTPAPMQQGIEKPQEQIQIPKKTTKQNSLKKNQWGYGAVYGWYDQYGSFYPRPDMDPRYADSQQAPMSWPQSNWDTSDPDFWFSTDSEF